MCYVRVNITLMEHRIAYPKQSEYPRRQTDRQTDMNDDIVQPMIFVVVTLLWGRAGVGRCRLHHSPFPFLLSTQYTPTTTTGTAPPSIIIYYVHKTADNRF